MFRELLAHHQELKETVGVAYSAPDDGREVPETCRAVIMIMISKSCFSLVTFKEFICNDARSYEYKINLKMSVLKILFR